MKLKNKTPKIDGRKLKGKDAVVFEYKNKYVAYSGKDYLNCSKEQKKAVAGYMLKAIQTEFPIGYKNFEEYSKEVYKYWMTFFEHKGKMKKPIWKSKVNSQDIKVWYYEK